MKVTIEEIKGLKEIELNIRCENITPEILALIDDLKCKDTRILGMDEGDSYLLYPKEIYYIDTVDDKVFAYTKNKIYKLNMKLYELEELLPTKDFFRVSKSTIVNLNFINSLKTLFNGKIQATMKSGEYVIISRAYVPAFKDKLGVYKK